MNSKIRKASIDDIPGILSVQSENLLVDNPIEAENQGEYVCRHGFFIHPLTKDYIEKVITHDDHHVYVYEEMDEIIGYILAYDLHAWLGENPHWLSELLVTEESRSSLTNDKVLFVDYIGRRKGHKGRSIGTDLELRIFDEARKKGFQYIIAEILDEPFKNVASTRFHEKLGYVKMGTHPEGNKYIWGLWKKDLATDRVDI